MDKDRALGGNSANYLSRLDADERPVKGVHINDNKAMFLFRWYQEVGADGNIFKDANGHASYQNAGCKSYFLPLDNGHYPFEWVSNFQVITAVHLKAHPTKNRTFILAAKEKKTVTEAMKKL